MKKKIGFLALAAVVICALFCTTAFASAADTAAQNLSAAGIFRGTGSGFDLGRTPTRQEAAVMLVRLLGKEQTAEEEFAAGSLTQPFTDVAAWAEADVAWLYTNGVARGTGVQTFGGSRACPAKDYAVFLLRALGYQDGTDFTYDTAETFAAGAGFYSADLFGGTFTRGDLALMSERALAAAVNGGEQNLLETLVEDGAVSDADAGPLRDAITAGTRLHISQAGVSIDEDAWDAVCDTMEITVSFQSSYSSIPAGETTLAGDELKALMVSDGEGHVSLGESALSALFAKWEKTYNRFNMPYVFDSYVKGPIGVTFIHCNYLFDEQKLAKALRQQIFSLESGTAETGFVCCDTKNKPFNIQDSHVEVDIDNQQLTLVRNGRVIVNTNIVTGALTGHQTPTGLYWAHNKQTNITLSGEDYSVFVKYWISVVGDSIGLHDASWRWSFGGDNYVNNGSHGCVNIPESAMVKIYANVYEGMPVLIHGHNTWYQPGSGSSPATVNPTRGTTARKGS